MVFKEGLVATGASLLERTFRLKEQGTSVPRELLAGATTFMTMAYIIFVQPQVMHQAGMDLGAAMMATCLASWFACWLMAFTANYPVGLAPGMGENFFFTFTIVAAHQVSWQTALGAVFLSGILFMFLTFLRVRELVIDAVPDCLKHAIAAGIGLFIALIGMKDAGIVVDNPAGLIQLGSLKHPAVLLSLAGILVTMAFLIRRIKGAILIGILISTVLAVVLKLTHFEGIVSAPPSIEPTFLKLDIAGALRLDPAIILLLLFMVMFDTLGTLIGVSTQANLLRDGRLPRATQALFSDAAGTTAGALLGTSTVTCYIESAAGVQAGGRTGLTVFFTGIFFLVAIFFYPLVQLIGGGVKLDDATVLHPITAPALVVVGCMMMQSIRRIDWDNAADALPSFLIIAGIPFTFSIADGIALGLIAYPAAQAVRGKRAPWLTWLLAAFFVLRFLL